MIRRTFILTGAVVAFLVGVASSAFAAPIPAPERAIGPDVTVTWPAVTAFNPDVYDFVADVQWSGEGSVWFRPVYEDRVVLDQVETVGLNRVELPAEAGDGHVAVGVWSCPTDAWVDGGCRLVAQSAALSVYRAMHLVAGQSVLGPNSPIPYAATPPIAADVAWTIAQNAEPIASGIDVDVPATGPLLALGPQPELVQGGQYHLSVAGRGEAENFGPLTGTGPTTSFRWDAVNESTIQMGQALPYGVFKDRTDFYPAPDSYVDSYTFRVTDDLSDVYVTVTSSDGSVVFNEHHATEAGQDDVVWDGSDGHGGTLPAGTYHATVVLRDPANNMKSATADIELRPQQIVEKTWKHTFTPANTFVQVENQRCGWIRTNAHPGWPGSMGLHTRDRCHGDPRTSYVRVLYQADVPPSFHRLYGQFRLTVEGGQVKGTRSSLWVNYLEKQQRRLTMIRSMSLRGPSQKVSGPSQSLDPWGPARAPHVNWEAVDSQGSRFDIKRFTVEIEYAVFE